MFLVHVERIHFHILDARQMSGDHAPQRPTAYNADPDRHWPPPASSIVACLPCRRLRSKRQKSQDDITLSLSISAEREAMPAKTVREATYDLLRSAAMTTIFGNPGSTELPFLGDL